MLTHVADSPIFKRKGENFEVEVPLTIPEALRGAEVQVPTLERQQDTAGQARHNSRHRSAPARRGAAEAVGGGAASGRHPLPLRDRRPRRAQRRAARGSAALAGYGRRTRARGCSEAGAPNGASQAGQATNAVDATRVEVASDRGVFMISVAARACAHAPTDASHLRGARLDRAQALAQGHPPLLPEDVEKLRRIQELTAELGLNLAGVERVLDLESEIGRCTPVSRSSRCRRCAPRSSLPRASRRCGAPSGQSCVPLLAAARRSCAPPTPAPRWDPTTDIATS